MGGGAGKQNLFTWINQPYLTSLYTEDRYGKGKKNKHTHSYLVRQKKHHTLSVQLIVIRNQMP